MVCIPGALVVLVIFAVANDMHAQLDITTFEHKFFSSFKMASQCSIWPIHAPPRYSADRQGRLR